MCSKYHLIHIKGYVTCKKLLRGKEFCFDLPTHPGLRVTSGPIELHSLGYMLPRGTDCKELARARKLTRSETRGNFLTPG